MDEDVIKKSVLNEDMINFTKSYFYKLNTIGVKNLIIKLFSDNVSLDNISINCVGVNNKTFIKNNKKRLKEISLNDKIKYYFDETFLEEFKLEYLEKLKEIFGEHVFDLEEDDPKWLKRHIDEHTKLVSDKLTFEEMQKFMCDEGKDIKFVYDFTNKKSVLFNNKYTIQVIQLTINSYGEKFDFPLNYKYVCPECKNVTYKKMYEVVSANKKRIKCPHQIDYEDKDGKIKHKRCNNVIEPAKNNYEVKPFFVTNGIYETKENDSEISEIISERRLPMGKIKTAVLKIPREYGTNFMCVVDYEIEEKQDIKLPEKKSEHYIFDLIEMFDKYIIEKTGYKHYGFLPMKIAVLIQFAVRYMKKFSYDFNIALVGSRSTGKTVFAEYWGALLYCDKFMSTKSKSISIPKLRGTMEKIRLFNQEFSYQYRGLLGEKDLIVIDELKEDPYLKDDLKSFMRSSHYDFSKQGGNAKSNERTTQMIITENINTAHLARYRKAIKDIYTGFSFKINEEDTKPAWDESWDLELPLYVYNNEYLKMAINQVRQNYEQNETNWIDGSELALKDRFIFYFFVEMEKDSKDFDNVIRENNERNANNYGVEDLKRQLKNDNIKQLFSKIKVSRTGVNEKEYYEKLVKLMKRYNKSLTPRIKSDYMTMLKVLRMIDNRKEYNDKDLNIIEYLMDNIDNKIDVVDTNDFKLKGYENTDIVDIPADEMDYNFD